MAQDADGAAHALFQHRELVQAVAIAEPDISFVGHVLRLAPLTELLGVRCCGKAVNVDAVLTACHLLEAAAAAATDRQAPPSQADVERCHLAWLVACRLGLAADSLGTAALRVLEHMLVAHLGAASWAQVVSTHACFQPDHPTPSHTAAGGASGDVLEQVVALVVACAANACISSDDPAPLHALAARWPLGKSLLLGDRLGLLHRACRAECMALLEFLAAHCALRQRDVPAQLLQHARHDRHMPPDGADSVRRWHAALGP